MADKKKSKPTVKKPSVNKTESAEPNDVNVKIKEALNHIKTIYTVNGKFKSQLVEIKDGEWICQIWSIADDGRQRPMIRNIQPFATMEEAIQMAQEVFAKFTGDDRYFAKEDIVKENKPE